jgi:hypothetical protein
LGDLLVCQPLVCSSDDGGGGRRRVGPQPSDQLVAPGLRPEVVSPVAVLRSLATHFDADLDEVTADYRNGTLARYFKRSDVPTPAVVAARSADHDEVPLDIRRKRLELWRRKMSWDEPPIDLKRARLALWERKIKMDDEEIRGIGRPEARSLQEFRRDRYGNAVDWHPAQQ